MSGDIPVVSGPHAADSEAEAFLAHEGTAAVADGGGSINAVPIEGSGELAGFVFVPSLEVIDSSSRDGEVGGTRPAGDVEGSGFVVAVLQRPAGDGNGTRDDGCDEFRSNGAEGSDAPAPGDTTFAFLACGQGRILELEFERVRMDPRGQPATGMWS